MTQTATAEYAGTMWLLAPGDAPAAVAPLLPATFARVGPDEADRLTAAMGLTDPVEAQRRFATGRRCYAAACAGELAAYGWVSLDQEAVGELGLVIQLAPGNAYIWDCATAPAFRRRHLYTALLAYIAGALRAEGRRRIWIGAAPDNTASHAGIMRAGFQPVADLFLARATRQFTMRGRPGIPTEVVAAASQLFRDEPPQE
jgi:ribosomal protein S18 acetylase RimI-like enzyme